MVLLKIRCDDGNFYYVLFYRWIPMWYGVLCRHNGRVYLFFRVTDDN